MKLIINKYFILFLSIVIAGLLYGGHVIFQPVKIIASHKNAYTWHILVDKFPLTSKARIYWWLENKEILFKSYGVPENWLTENNIAVWRFGDGYKALEKYDRLCFDDMPPPKNCIEKDRLMYITLTRNGEVSYWLNNTRYIQKANGELVEVGFN
ncbi:DUF943 family protein [Mixta calida]|uniref:DUF943 family protein n=1 Tax=Mixta calida TaxID=665913 RepID=UPI002FDED78F